MAILIISSDIPELVSLCTRILVIHEGSMMGNIAAADASENLLLQMATGYGDIAVSNSQQTSGAAK
jgi:ABC-type sugar transport system ATPase subunit